MIPFVKYHGSGNDFILIDRRHKEISLSPQSIRSFCDRHRGVGADGLVFLSYDKEADARMQIFNADGAEASMCGNALLCLADFAHSLSFPSAFSVRTASHIASVYKQSSAWHVSLPSPIAPPLSSFFFSFEGKEYEVFTINTSVPHALVETRLSNLKIESFGKALREDPRSGPQGANASFIERSQGKISFRCYERGVEAETLACGTAACAAALFYAHRDSLSSPLLAFTQSGDALSISFQRAGNLFDHLTLSGKAVPLFASAFKASGAE